MNAIEPREDPQVVTELAQNVRHGWRTPISIILIAGVIVAIVALVGWR